MAGLGGPPSAAASKTYTSMAEALKKQKDSNDTDAMIKKKAKVKDFYSNLLNKKKADDN